MAELTLYTPEMPWEVLNFIPGSAEVKILRDESEGGARTVLVRLSPGGVISPHVYLGVVQHSVLEGEYECEGRDIRRRYLSTIVEAYRPCDHFDGKRSGHSNHL